MLEKVKNIRVPAYMAELVARWKKFSRENPGVTDVKAAIAAIEAPDDNDDPDENLNAFDNLESAIGAAFKHESHLYDAIWP